VLAAERQPRRLGPLLARQLAALRVGRFDDVLATTESILALSAGNYRARVVQAIALHELGRADEARATLRTANDLFFPGDPTAEALLDEAYERVP